MSGTTQEPTPEQLAAASAATQQEQQAAASGEAVETNLPPLRPRRPLSEALSPDATPSEVQAHNQLQIDAVDTTHLTELERLSIETRTAVQRRLDDEQRQEEMAGIVADQVAETAKVSEEHERAVAEYNERQQAIREASKENPVDTPEGMVRVRIVSNVSVVQPDGTLNTYTTTGSNTGIPGEWDMPEADANNWHLLHHTDNPPPVEPPMPGTPAAASIAMRVQASRALAEYMLDQQEHQAAEALRAKRQESIKAAMGDQFEPAPAEPPPPPPQV